MFVCALIGFCVPDSFPHALQHSFLYFCVLLCAFIFVYVCIGVRVNIYFSVWIFFEDVWLYEIENESTVTWKTPRLETANCYKRAKKQSHMIVWSNADLRYHFFLFFFFLLSVFALDTDSLCLYWWIMLNFMISPKDYKKILREICLREWTKHKGKCILFFVVEVAKLYRHTFFHLPACSHNTSTRNPIPHMYLWN